MLLFVMRFWPVLIPLLIYWLWWLRVGKRATIEGKPVLRFRDGPWYWAVLASLLTGIGCFIFLGLEIEPVKGAYAPPHIENGKVVPGSVQ